MIIEMKLPQKIKKAYSEGGLSIVTVRSIRYLYSKLPTKLRLKLTAIKNYLNGVKDLKKEKFWKYGEYYFPSMIYPGQITKVNQGYSKLMGAKYTLPQEGIEIDKNDKVVDVGAFVGAFSKFAAGISNNDVIAIEPTPKSYLCLKMNTEVKTINAAISKDECSFNISDDPTDNSLMNPDNGKIKSAIEVKTMELQEIEDIDFLKIDAEGYEPEVLETLGETKPKKISVDVTKERDGESSYKEVREILEKMDYCVFKKDGVAFARQ